GSKRSTRKPLVAPQVPHVLQSATPRGAFGSQVPDPEGTPAGLSAGLIPGANCSTSARRRPPPVRYPEAAVNPADFQPGAAAATGGLPGCKRHRPGRRKDRPVAGYARWTAWPRPKPVAALFVLPGIPAARFAGGQPVRQRAP